MKSRLYLITFLSLLVLPLKVAGKEANTYGKIEVTESELEKKKIPHLWAQGVGNVEITGKAKYIPGRDTARSFDEITMNFKFEILDNERNIIKTFELPGVCREGEKLVPKRTFSFVIMNCMLPKGLWAKVNSHGILNATVKPIATPEEIKGKYNEGLQKIFEIQRKIKSIHPFLENLFPVVIVEENTFFIFDLDSSGNEYSFVKKAPTPMPIPKGIRAAFPLPSYEGKPCCIVSGDVFESLEGYAVIFHEFMHCNQFLICEERLKSNMEVAKESGDPSWEVNYPFPYEDSTFTKIYSNFLKSLEQDDSKGINRYREKLKETLKKKDFEYMVWQEWKEGFARLIENRIRRKLGLEENHYGKEKPYNRITFYVGGSKFISFLTKQNPELRVDIENLFYKMFENEDK